MTATRFTGPLQAGNVFDTTGTTVGANVSNVGYCDMIQSQAGVTQASGVTTIVIPAQSQILEIVLMVTTAWTGGATTFGVGSTVSATALTPAAAATGAALGKLLIVPGTGATQIANWDNVGTTDIQIQLTSTNTGSGVGTLTVRYVQAINLAS